MDWNEVRYWHRTKAPKSLEASEKFPAPSASDIYIFFLSDKYDETRTASLSPEEYRRLVELSEPEWIPDWEYGTLFWRPIQSQDQIDNDDRNSLDSS